VRSRSCEPSSYFGNIAIVMLVRYMYLAFLNHQGVAKARIVQVSGEEYLDGTQAGRIHRVISLGANSQLNHEMETTGRDQISLL
jgi:hypothetical protein